MRKGLTIAGGFIALVGVLCFAVLTVTNAFDGASVIQAHEMNYFGMWTWKYYTFDVYKYYLNLQSSINPNQLIAILPNFPSMPLQPKNWADIGADFKFIAQILVVFIPNVLIFFINILIWPIKIIIYPVNIMLAIFGFNTSDLEWVVTFKAIYSLGIPFIPYW